jgi:uncharacterized protein (TIGR02246 family)
LITGQGRDIKAIHRLTGEWAEATTSKDIPKLLSLLSDDVVFLPAGALPVKGKAAVEAMYRMLFAQFSRVEQAAVIDEIQLSGDWAFSCDTDTLHSETGSRRRLEIRARHQQHEAADGRALVLRRRVAKRVSGARQLMDHRASHPPGCLERRKIGAIAPHLRFRQALRG